MADRSGDRNNHEANESRLEIKYEGDEMSAEEGIFVELQGFVKFVYRKRTSDENEDDTELKHMEETHAEKGESLTDIFSKMESRIVPPQSRNRPSEPSVFRHMAILSHTTQSYLQILEAQQLTKLSIEAHMQSSQWIAKMFKFDNGFCYFHHDKFSGIVKVCKLALHMKYSKYFTDGFTALYTRPPMVYISSAAPQGFGREIRNQLGLPQSSICTVPCIGNQSNTSPSSIDVPAFERLLTDDVSCGKTPLVLIAYAGTPLTGHTDDLSRLREICTQAGVWLHVEGDTLATLALDNVPQSIQAAVTADSMAINMCNWLSLSTLPAITLYRTSNPSTAVASGLSSLNHMEQLIALPLWMTMSYLGLQVVRDTIKHACVLAEQLSNRLDSLSGIKRLDQNGAISTTVLFKYKASPPLSYNTNSSLEDADVEEHSKESSNLKTVPALAPRTSINVSTRLRDAFNHLLVERLQQQYSRLIIDLVTIPVEGSCIRFQPLQTAVDMGTSCDDIDNFTESLEADTKSLDSLLLMRDSFTSTFCSVRDVTLIDVTDVPAIGAFQCMPRYWKSNDVTNLSDSKKRECNALTSEVYNRLAERFPEVRQGRTSTGLVCIHVGMPTKDFSVENFHDCVISIAAEFEDNSQYIESLSETIQANILEAQTTLEKESDEKFFEEGVLRNVPVFGSVYNWLSPPSKGPGVRGRTFNIASGKLDTTESTYKYKMQVTDGDKSETETKEDKTEQEAVEHNENHHDHHSDNDLDNQEAVDKEIESEPVLESNV